MPVPQSRAGARLQGWSPAPQRGYAMLLVFVLAAGIAIMLYMEMPRVAFESQRQKEQLLIDRGDQYKRAIQLFYRKYRTYPQNLDDLETTRNIRFLRRRYKDPMTGKDEWRLIHVGPAGQLTDSLVQSPLNPLGGDKNKTTADASNGGAGGTGGSGGTGSGDQGNPGLNMANRRPSDRILTGTEQPAGMPQDGDPNQQMAQQQPQYPQPQYPAQQVPGQQYPAQYPGQPVQPGDPNQQQPGQVPGQPGQAPGQSGDPNQQMPPGQQPQFPGQQFPGQQYPGQPQTGQYPGQPQFPGQQFPGQQYPGQPQTGQYPQQPQFPGQQFPGQQYPGQPQTGEYPQQPGQPQYGQPQYPGQPQFPQPQYQQPPQYAYGQPGAPGQPYQQQPGQPQYNPFQPRGVLPPGAPPPPAPALNPGTPGVPTGGPSAAVGLIQQILTTPRQPPAGIGGGLTGGGTGLAGVASTAKGEGIHLINDRSKYQEWEFVYDLKNDKSSAGLIQQAQQLQQLQQQGGQLPGGQFPGGQFPGGQFPPGTQPPVGPRTGAGGPIRNR